MNERKWLECEELMPMLQFLTGKTTDRKLRLFACACCRDIWDLLTDECGRTAVEVGERFADGDAGGDDLHAASGEAAAAGRAVKEAAGAVSAAAWAAGEAAWSAGEAAWAAGTAEAAVAGAAEAAWAGAAAAAWAKPWAAGAAAGAAARARQADNLREIVGNPFAPVRFSPGWVTSDVRNLAETLYEYRRLPSGELDCELFGVLGDALEEVGCSNPVILEHCRSKGPHIRGCHVLDLVLGKS